MFKIILFVLALITGALPVTAETSTQHAIGAGLSVALPANWTVLIEDTGDGVTAKAFVDANDPDGNAAILVTRLINPHGATGPADEAQMRALAEQSVAILMSSLLPDATYTTVRSTTSALPQSKAVGRQDAVFKDDLSIGGILAHAETTLVIGATESVMITSLTADFQDQASLDRKAQVTFATDIALASLKGVIDD